MRGFFTRTLITMLGLLLARMIIPGISIPGWADLLVAALLLGLVNAIVRPILFVLTLPLTLITLGLFLLILNGISLEIVAWLMPGVTVSGLGAATLGALVVTVTSWFANSFIGNSGRIERWQNRVEVSGRRLD
ncbi:MAG TPA: phage holin family protein [Gemmatimonadales bacterium]|nr:phage holin family protein [Gemmatimonadales bacterium]